MPWKQETKPLKGISQNSMPSVLICRMNNYNFYFSLLSFLTFLHGLRSFWKLSNLWGFTLFFNYLITSDCHFSLSFTLPLKFYFFVLYCYNYKTEDLFILQSIKPPSGIADDREALSTTLWIRICLQINKASDYSSMTW